MRQSMNGTGNCNDNAPMESFWHTVMETAHVKPASRYPYWMRRGYVEELYDL